MFELIGPDSAGKASLFRIIASLLLADVGIISVEGYDVVSQCKEIRQRVGYIPGKFSLYQDLVVEGNLQFSADLFGTTIVAGYDGVEVIYSQVGPFKSRKVGVLSGGTKQKLVLFCAFIHQPSVLFLDEPTTGVGPASRKELWQTPGTLKERNITVVAAMPCLDEIRCYERVVFLDNGWVRTIDGPDETLTQFARTFNPEGLKRGDKSVQVQQGIAEEGWQEKAEDVIRAEHLIKAFGTSHTVDDISFSVHRGEIFGFLGASGAGKTAAMYILTGLNKPTNGKGKVAGFDIYKYPEQIKKYIGYMNQRSSLYENMVMAQNIKFFGDIYDMSKQATVTKMDNMLRQLHFETHRNSLVSSLPLRWKRELAFPANIFHKPEVVFLDKPTGGVNPATRRWPWKLIYAVSTRGITIFVTTYYVDEAKYRNRTSVMVDEKIRTIDAPNELKRTYRCNDMDEVFTLLTRQVTRRE